jgi:hypothetical protein
MSFDPILSSELMLCRLPLMESERFVLELLGLGRIGD